MKKLFVLASLILVCGCNGGVSTSEEKYTSNNTTSSQEVIKKEKITINQTEHGKITCLQTEEEIGKEVIFNVISEERYYLEEVKVNNQAIEVNDNTFTYIMVEGGLTIDATFKCKYNYTIGDSSSWEILEENNIVTFKSTTDDAQLMFNNIFFTKGTIEFDMKVPSTDSKWLVNDGIVIGSDTLQAKHDEGKFHVVGISPWGDFTTHYKNNNTFDWDNNKQLSKVFNFDEVQHLKFVIDEDVIHYYLNGKYIISSPLKYQLDGKYLGLYVNHLGTEISSIKINEELLEEERPFICTTGNASNVKYENNSYSLINNEYTLIMLKGQLFTNGTVEFDISFTDQTNHVFNCIDGIVIGSDQKYFSENIGTYLVAGIDPWSEFVASSKTNGIYAWDDNFKVGNVCNELNKTYHLKFIYNEKTITYYYDNEEKGSALINAPVSGAYCGIQLDHSGVTISNIKFN